jgi:hypothetical protein
MVVSLGCATIYMSSVAVHKPIPSASLSNNPKYRNAYPLNMVSTTTFVFANRSDMPPDQSLAWPCNPSQTIRSSSDSLGSGSSTRTRFVDTTSVFSRKYLSTFLASIAASEHVLGGSDVLFGLVVKLVLLKVEEILLFVTLFDSSSPSPV